MVHTDNQNVVKIVKSGSMKKDLHDIACTICWPLMINSDGKFKTFDIGYVKYVKPRNSHKESV